MAGNRPAQPTDPKIGGKGILCPYCGHVSHNPKRCDSCGGYFDPLSRQASQNAMGPWYIRDAKGPFRPGCSFETVRELVKRGKVTQETVIRGPTTRQFWNFAGRTPTVANLLGVCHNCGSDVGPEDYSCGACGAVFTPETDRQHLGLAPVHLLPGQATPEMIAASSGAPEKSKKRGAGAPPKGTRGAPSAWALVGLGAGVLVVMAGVIGGAVWKQGLAGSMWAEVVGDGAPAAQASNEVTEGTASSTAAVENSDGAETGAARGESSAMAEQTADEPVKEAAKEQEPAVVPAVGLDELGAVVATLAAGTEFDQGELMARLEKIERDTPGKSTEARAVEELVARRIEQGKLKKLP